MKKIIKTIFLLVLFFIGTINCFATDNTILAPEIDRKTLDNYGVNKHWEITDSNKDNILRTPYVDASKKIYDYSNILTEEEEKKLYIEIEKFVKKSKIDMVILTNNMSYVSDYQNEEYAVDFYDYNDFGIDFENYSGIVLFRNTYTTDPYFNIYTFGNAQLYFPYERCENVLDVIYPNISNHNYYDGFEQYINEISSYYEAGIPYSMKSYKVNKDGYLEKIYVIPFIPIAIISLIVTTIVMIILIKKNKMVVKASTANEYLDKNSINYTKRKDDFITSHTSSYTVSSSSGGGGSSSRSGSSGGGHGGGGGRHG